MSAPSVTVEQLAALAAAGLTTEQIVRAVEVLVRGQAEDIIASRRKKDRERKANKRAEAKAKPEESPQVSTDKVLVVPIIDTLFPEDSGKGKEEIQHAREPKRGRRLPDDFAPDATVEAIARERGLTRRQWTDWLEEFRDYWRGAPGQRGVKLDWQATARNGLKAWIGRNLKGNGNGTNHRPALRDEFAGACDLIDAKYGTGQDGGGSNILQLPGLRQSS